MYRDLWRIVAERSQVYRAWRVCLALGCLVPGGGCGVVVGTVIDKTIDGVRYPFQEYVFWGAFKHDDPWEATWQSPPPRREHGDVLVGVCFSGGGSRAAYFAACVLDELGKRRIPGFDRSYLEEVDFISSVSGGSLAAAYYCLNRHRPGFPPEHAAFFARMRRDMRRNFEMRALGRVAAGYWLPLFFTYYDRGDLMAAVWDANFLDGRTFADIDIRAPALLINATTYDTGQRFLFTPLPLAQLRRAGSNSATIAGLELGRGFARAYDPEGVVTFETLDSDIGQCPLSTAVVASASVPNLLGPVRLRNRRDGSTVHLGDGGIYDNHGFATMVDVLGRALADSDAREAYILIVDAAGYFDIGESAGDISTVAEFADRTLSISWLRAATLFEATLQLGLKDLDDERQLRYAALSVYDEEAVAAAVDAQKRDLTWGEAVAEQVARTAKVVQRFVPPVELVNPVTLMKDVRAIGTRFSLADDAVASLDSAAVQVTAGALDRVESEWFDERGSKPAAARPDEERCEAAARTDE